MQEPLRCFIPVSIAILTISDKRDDNSNTSGHYLKKVALESGHYVEHCDIIGKDRYLIRSVISKWVASSIINVIITSGGTGFSARNNTPEAIYPLLDREINGFDSLVHMISYKEIGAATLQSRPIAGIANRTLIFSLPGSTSACQSIWHNIISHQIDSRTSPCNFISHLKDHEHISTKSY